MVFTRRRGRPRINRARNDLGTEELQTKRKSGLTAEPLDILLARGLVSSSEHKAGTSFRWLYTVKFGLPGVRAIDLSDSESKIRFSGRDDAWRECQEKNTARLS